MRKGTHFAYPLVVCAILIANSQSLFAQASKVSLSFTVSMPHPASQRYHVVFRCDGLKKDAMEVKMPAWMPGYYQLLNYANYVENFNATTVEGKSLKSEKNTANGWKIWTGKAPTLIVSYEVKSTRSFVATNYLDASRGYIAPTGLFMYLPGMIKHPVSVTIEPNPGWAVIATGLDSIKGKRNSYFAPDFDALFDSPILMGNLEAFPSFTVKGIPHHFVAYKPGQFDRRVFMDDLKKIVTTASGIIGEIPYKHYTFLGIGPGGGGIEHLNSTSIAFSGNELNDPKSRVRTYNFLAHEYFHHYNVKRIRPVELGPFDYDHGSRTKMLWFSEGVTVYYEYVILRRAGLTTTEEILRTFQSSIRAYEGKPGRYFQTPAEASYNTWEDGPFGRTADEVNKTISPYDKGPALGLLLDLKIRHETKNKKSLDDLMRLLYNKYYKQKARGFTENEFRAECELMAGGTLSDFFDYIYTLKPVDYPAYLHYAGLSIDTVSRELPGAWLGTSVRDRNDTLWTSGVEWQSPSWDAGLRNGRSILLVDGKKLNAKELNEKLNAAKAGDKIKILFTSASGAREAVITLGTKKERSYSITPTDKPDPLQASILKSWLGEK